jgi:hypothetical protein
MKAERHVAEPVSGTEVFPPRPRSVGRLQGWAPAFCCLVLLVQACHAVTIPIGEHNDSRTVLDSATAILAGHYQRSRSLGVPLYEGMAALWMAIGGSLLANLYSLALAIGSVLLFDHLLGRGLAPIRRIPALAAFALNPIFVSNATMLIEWMQVFFFLLCLLTAAAAVRRTQSAGSLACYALASAACALTRPDLGAFCAALLLAMLWETRNLRLGALLIAADLAAAALTIGVMLSLNSIHELSTAVTVEDRDVWRRIALSILDAVALFGVPGAIAALALTVGIFRRACRDGINRAPFETKLLLFVLPEVVLRLIGLPSKVEFLFPLLIVLLLAAARQARGVVGLGVLAASLVLGSVVQISFLQRTGPSDQLHFRLGLNAGAVAQDYDRRVQNTAMFEPDYLEQIARLADPGGSTGALHPRAFFPGLISERNDLVIGATELYQLDNPRFYFGQTRLMFAGNGDSRRSAYRHIYVCDKSVAAAGKGWRVLQPPPPTARLDPATGQVDTRCSLEHIGGPG